MPSFRWPLLYHDIALAREVFSKRPDKPHDWDLIAANISAYFSRQDGKAVSLKGRGCKDRLELLLKKYKQEDRKALKRSGTEEEYSELQQLLEDVSSYLQDLEAIRAAEAEVKAAKLKRIEADKQKGEEIRRAAMEGMPRRKRRSHTPPESDSENVAEYHDDDGEDELYEEPVKKKKTEKEVVTLRSSRRTALESFETRHKEKMALREKELNIRQKELELQKQKLELEEEARRMRWEVEREERKQRMELEMEERKLIFDVLKKCL